MLIGFALIAAGYAGVYYAVNVLVWAHFSVATEEPVPFAMCLGFPSKPRGQPFMPPVTLGIQIPGAITDARGLLGGVPSTGQYVQATDGLAKGESSILPTTPGGVPLNPGMGSTAPGGGGTIPPNDSQSVPGLYPPENPVTRPRPPGFVGPVAFVPPPNPRGRFVGPVAPDPGPDHPASAGRPATGVYRQGGMQQWTDGHWRPIP